LVAIDWAVYGLPPVHPGSGRMGLSESALWLTLATGATICGVWLGIAAWKMSQLRSYEWVIIASVLAILPFSPAWIIGFPLGLWSLATLTRSAATRAFGRRKLQEAESALSGSSRTAQPHLGESERGYQHAIDVNEQVESTSKLPQSRKTLFEEGNTALHGLIVPAVGMLIAGTALTLLLGVAIFRGLPSDFKNWWVVGLGGPLLLLGGMAMKGGRSYWLAFAASLVCLAIGFATLYFIFLLPFVPIGLLYVGAHSLWQLMQPDVVEEFRQQSRSGISFGRRRLVITVTLVLPMLALVCAAPLFMAQLDKSRNMLARRDVKSRVGDEVASPAGAVDAPEPSPPSDVQDQPPAPPAPVQNETANVQLRGADENGAPPVMERSSRGEDANNANSVSGVVMFGEKGVSAEVILESPDGTQIGSIRSDDRGRFTFHDVAAGKYVLKVRGVARNQIRQAEQEITVLPRPQKPTDLTVELR